MAKSPMQVKAGNCICTLKAVSPSPANLTGQEVEADKLQRDGVVCNGSKASRARPKGLHSWGGAL